MAKISGSDAVLKVIQKWGVKHIYGLPGGSFDSTMNAIYNQRETLKYIQVRHEEAGAIAASADYKLTGKIGVCFGSAGPGAVHLLNGLYDAKEDGIPMLAIVAQVPTKRMNMDFFQAMNEEPIFDDVAVWNRTAMTAESLPMMTDEAIRQAYAHNGVAVLTIPKDFGWAEIEDNFETNASVHTVNYPAPTAESVALLCTLGTALVVLRVDLNSLPAQLLQPRAPKAGKTLLLERWQWLWHRLNFNHKITLRNLFRYKQRLLMTVLGIAGCMAMMITGFGLKDSIGDISVKQFNELWHYDAVVTRSGNETDQQRQALSRGQLYQASLKLQAKQVTVKQSGVAEQTATLGIPAPHQSLSKFVVLRHRQSHQAIHIGNRGAVIDEKLAKLYGVHAGDDLTIKLAGQTTKRIHISAVAENYVNHFIYMSPTYYRRVFKQAPVYNTNYVRFKQATKKQENAYADRLLKQAGVQNVTLMSTEKATNFKMLDSMNLVVLIFVISAGALALVVLYNLTNINVSERIRELSTIKVLGFYDGEVTMYIFRENLILTVLGIIAGCFLGNWLHAYILQTAETNALMFSPTIHPLSYVYAALLTLAFSLLVMGMMHRKLKRVNMLDALKSVD